MARVDSHTFLPLKAWIWDIGATWKERNVWNPWTVGNQTAGYLSQFNVPESKSGAKGSFSLVTVGEFWLFRCFVFRRICSSHMLLLDYCTGQIHGAGHEVPAYRPMESLHMLKAFLSGKWRL
jgi:hypothetical protein